MAAPEDAAQQLPCCGTACLTEREIDVLCALAAGNTSPKAAEILQMSRRTVDTHVASMLRKADVRSRIQLIAQAVARGVLDMSVQPPRWTGRLCLRSPQISGY